MSLMTRQPCCEELSDAALVAKLGLTVLAGKEPMLAFAAEAVT